MEPMASAGMVRAFYQMRYSYFGLSGWRSAASRDPGMLFDRDRLSSRFRHFVALPLPSLAAQTDPDFKLVILSSQAMPKYHKRMLTEAACDILGADRVDLLFEPPGSAGHRFRRYMKKRGGAADWSMQVVLDDDDALSTDFNQIMRAEARAAITLFREGQDYVFLSQAQGLSVVLNPDSKAALSHRNVPMNNQGLTLVGGTRIGRSPFNTAHKQLARNHPVRVLHDTRPYYIRAVHDTNDSRAIVSETPVDPGELPGLLARFPFLADILSGSFKPRPRDALAGGRSRTALAAEPAFNPHPDPDAAQGLTRRNRRAA